MYFCRLPHLMPLCKFISWSTGETEATEVFIYDAAGKTESEMQRFAVPAAGIIGNQFVIII